MFNRYSRIGKIFNNTEAYSEVLSGRGLKVLQQYRTFNFRDLNRLNELGIDYIYHTVQPFEKLYMISNRYYDAPEYGWLICYTNILSSEMQIYEGINLKIFYPLDKVLENF